MKLKLTILISILPLVILSIIGFASGDDRDDVRSSSLEKTRVSEVQSLYYIEYGPPLAAPLSALNESFESTTFPPPGWIKINVASGATGWIRQLVGTSPVPGFNGGVITSPPGGGNAVAFCNFLTGGTDTNDQWLVTPQLTNIRPTDSLKFWLRKFGAYLDHLDIKISTTTPTVAAMTTTVALLTFQWNDSGWVYYQYRIGTLVSPGSNIYIGFRQWVTNSNNDGASFSLDLVSVTGPVGVTGNNNEVPEFYSLSQNYPNPFNPATTIEYRIPEAGNVKLTVYDVLGNEVRVLADEFKRAGGYKVSFDATGLSTGVYFYRLFSRNFTDTKKMTLIK